MPVFGQPRVFHKKFKFIFEIDGFNFFGFQKCSALEAEIAKIEYWEGGSLIANKDLGRITVPDLTIQRAACFDLDQWNWFVQCANMVSRTGQVSPTYKRGGDIVQQERDGSEVRRWTCAGLAPVKFTAGDWDNDADENVIESLVLMLDTWTLVTAA